MELSLASYAGFFTSTPPTVESAFGIYWPALVPADAVTHAVLLPDGTRCVIEPTPSHPRTGVGAVPAAAAASGRTVA